MNGIWLIAAVELRRRWRELVLLGLLVTVSAGAVMASAVASARAGSSVDRLLEWSRLSDVGLPAGTVEDTRAMIEELSNRPEVELLTVGSTISVVVLDDDQQANVDDQQALVDGININISAPDPIGTATGTGVHGIDLDRLWVLEGRLPRPDRPEEIMLHEWIVDATGWKVGDRLTGRTLAAADLEQLYEGSFPGMNGPTLKLVVVGIGRAARDAAGVLEQDSIGGYGSESLVELTRDEALWWPPSIGVRTTHGPADVERLWEGLSVRDAFVDNATFAGTFVGGIADVRAALIESSTKTVDTMALGLTVFAFGAGTAGALAIGQAVTRHLAGGAEARTTLRQLGQSRNETAIAMTIPVAVMTTAGVLIGAGGAISASARLPTGLAGRIEVDPGIWVRPDIIVPVGAATIATVTLFCFVLARRSSERDEAAARRPAPPARLVPLESAPAVSVGMTLALDRGRGSRTLPTRSAFAAMVLSVIAVTAAVMLAHNYERLSSTPGRWGWNWSTMPDYLGADPMEDVLARVAADPRIVGAGMSAANGVSINGSSNGAFAMEVVSGEIRYTIRDGRLPAGPGEVALGARTLRRLDASIGDTIDIADLEGNNGRRVTVVGTAVVPYDTAGTFDDGAVLLPETLFAITDENTALRIPLLRYAPDVDAEALEADLAAEHGLVFDRFNRPNVPGPVSNVSVTRQVGVALGIFFSGLAVLSVTHTLIVSSRRRGVDLAVLRTLGFVRGQVRLVFLVQALAFGLVAVAVGTPLGLAIGRLVWRTVTDDLGAVTNPSMPWLVVLLVIPACLLVAALLSWWPGRRAARQHPGELLRVR